MKVLAVPNNRCMFAITKVRTIIFFVIHKELNSAIEKDQT